MIRVTIHMRDGRQFFVDDVQKVSQRVLDSAGQEKLVTAWRSAILRFPFATWRETVVEGKAKIFVVDPFKIEAIEAELMDKEG